MDMKRLSFAIIITAVLLIACGTLLVPDAVALADDTIVVGDFIYAPPSNLRDNATAVASAIPVYASNKPDDVAFYLSESYYAKVTSVNDKRSKSYTVTIGDEGGFIIYFDDAIKATSSLDLVSEALPDVRLTVRSDVENVFVTTATETINLKNGTFVYFGENENQVYVKASYNDFSDFVLIDKTNFNDYTIPYHSIAEAERAALIQTPTDNGGEIGSNDGARTSKTLRIILIIGIVIPAALIAFLLFKPSRGNDNYDKHAMKKKDSIQSDYDRDRRYSGRNYDRDDEPRRDYDKRDYDRRDYARYDRDYDRDDRRDRGYPPYDDYDRR